DELEAIIKLVARGLDVALIPQTASHHPWPEGIRALDLGEQTFHRDVGLVHRDRPSLNEPTLTLIDLLQRPYTAQ
uniref:LysR substrate-binding domain-containing protein n=1 Tax=Pseudomonas viridiflava TaxID=33069 RepID=UPI001F14731F